MNLMFRKNFREQKSGPITGKGAKSTVGRHASKRCTREQGYTPMEEHHYRTHLFFSPPRCSYSQDDSDGEFGFVYFRNVYYNLSGETPFSLK